MIRVRVSRGVQAGLTGASGLLALSGGLAGCNAEPNHADEAEKVGTTASAFTVLDPGTGVFELGWAYGTPSGYSFVAKNSLDEYVRVGEQMSCSLPASFLWSRLYPNDPATDDIERLKKLSASVKVVFVQGGVENASTTVETNGTWTGDHSWDLTAQTASFPVAQCAQGVRFEITIRDAADLTKTVQVSMTEFLEVPILGGSLPDKTLLFDSLGPKMRQRVLEGGNPVSGATLSLAYTDWRAATVVDASSIDRQIGTAQSYGRFGTFEMPILGDLEYEVSYGAAFGGQWQAEQSMAENTASSLLPSGRTAYQASLAVPKTASSLHFYFHVKAYLVVDYSKYQNVTNRKYADGSRIFIRERWDNENGRVYDNYDFTTEGR